MSLDVVDEVVCAGTENFDHSVSSTSDRSTASQRSAIFDGISREGSSPSDQHATFTRDTRYIYVSLLGSLDRSAHFVCPSLVPKLLLLASQSSQLLQPASHARMMDPAQAQHRRPVVVIKVGCDQGVCDFGWHFLQGLPDAKIAATRLDPPLEEVHGPKYAGRYELYLAVRQRKATHRGQGETFACMCLEWKLPKERM